MCIRDSIRTLKRKGPIISKGPQNLVKLTPMPINSLTETTNSFPSYITIVWSAKFTCCTVDDITGLTISTLGFDSDAFVGDRRVFTDKITCMTRSTLPLFSRFCTWLCRWWLWAKSQLFPFEQCVPQVGCSAGNYLKLRYILRASRGSCSTFRDDVVNLCCLFFGFFITRSICHDPRSKKARLFVFVLVT